MKSNGALKPRQGASKQGCSPGLVQRKYRVKRYYKQQLQLQQQHQAAPQTRQQKQKQPQQPTKKCGEILSISSNYSLNSSDFSTCRETKKPNKSTTPNTTQFRNTRACCIDSYRRGIQEKTQQTTAAAISAAEAVTETATETRKTIIERNNKRKKKNFDIYLKRGGALNNNNYNITTRQIKKTKTNTENKNSNSKYNDNDNDNNKNTCYCKNPTKKPKTQVKVVKTTLITSEYNVSDNKGHCSGDGNKKVSKFFLLNPKIYENLNLIVLISRLFIQLKLLLFFMFSHAIKHLTGNSFLCFIGGGAKLVTGSCRAGTAQGFRFFGLVGCSLAKIMRASQSFEGSFERISFKNVNKTRLPPSIALCLMVFAAAAILLPQPVVGDDGDNFFPINGIETTTPEFDYASRGQKKFGDKCENTLECGFPGSICDPKKKSCQCTEDLPVTNHIDKCGKEAAVNESCFFNEQCEVKYFQTECRDQRCVCRFDMTPVWLKDGSVECKGRGDKKGPETYIDPAMIGVLIGMALMFIIICVVLRLFSQARWRENRTIFNTPNPRLMNVSLLRESKLLHGQERRGSRMSVRAPSRQPSMASLRPHSPNPSLGKTGSRSNSHGSNASATSLRSTRSNSVSPAGIVVNNSHHERKGSTYQPHQHHQPSQQKLHQHQQHQEQQPLTQTNIISNPVAETVTVEIIEPDK